MTHLALVGRQADYWWTVYRRTWRGSVFSSFASPLLYLLAMGVLLGRYVDTARGGGGIGGASSYLMFVAPGLLAAHAMQIAMGEVLWPVMGMIKWNKTYYAMIASPLRVVDVFGAHLGFIGFRLVTACGVFMLALAPFGVYASAAGAVLAFGAQLLIGMAFAAPFFGVGASAKTDSVFSVVYRVGVMPLFLFSGAFFPITALPPVLQVIAKCSPLYHGVELTRDLMLRPLASLDWGVELGHVAYLVVLVAVGAWWSIGRLQARLIS